MQSDFYKVALFPHLSTHLSTLLNSTHNEKENKWKIWSHPLNVSYRPHIQRCSLEPDTETLLTVKPQQDATVYQNFIIPYFK
jgi:hypothetical protein